MLVASHVAFSRTKVEKKKSKHSKQKNKKHSEVSRGIKFLKGQWEVGEGQGEFIILFCENQSIDYIQVSVRTKYFFFFEIYLRSREMAQKLKAPATFTEDLSSVPSTHEVVS